MKKIIIIAGITVVLLVVFWKVKEKPAPSASSKPTVASACQALTLANPLPNSTVATDFTVKVAVDNTNPKCHWSVFEAQAGTVELTDSSRQSVGKGVLKTSQDWMTNNPVTYTTVIVLSSRTTHGPLTITFNEEKANGEKGQTIAYPLHY